jgi:MFS transporter, DHA1 family, inner membrane transport protein
MAIDEGMPSPGPPSPKTPPVRSAAGPVLLLGNFVVGCTTFAPAAMLGILADSLSVGIGTAGLLMTVSGLVLCFASPIMAWATGGMDRRGLAAVTLAVVAAGDLLSALAPNFWSLLAIRAVMMAVAAIYTPLAASTVAMMVPDRERPSAVAFVFLGLSLAIAAGMPLLALGAGYLGWRPTYGAMAVAGALCGVLNLAVLPAGLRSTSLSFRSWGDMARNRPAVALFMITMLITAAQYVVFPYFGPLLHGFLGTGTVVTSVFFSILGVMGFVGNVAASRGAKTFEAFQISLCAIAALTAGLAIWSIGAGSLAAMAIGVCLWGLGFAAANSMQQARLIAAVPQYANLAVALNASWLFVGQAIGSTLGGALYAHGLPVAMGYLATALLAGALILAARTERTKPAAV